MILTSVYSDALDLRIKVYSTEETMLSATPRENTIGVVTATKIPSWIFSPAAPSAAEAGMLWIKIGTSSPRAFNALKKNGIVICPLAAAQYVSGNWVKVNAMSYQNGWKKWFAYLYNQGDEYLNLTGGWNAYAYKTSTSNSTASRPAVTKDAASIKIAFSSDDYRAGALFTGKTVNLTGISTLEMDVVDVGSNAGHVYFGISAEKKNNYTSAASKAVYEAGTVELDVSEFTGSYYVYVSMQGESTNHVAFDSIRMI